MGSILRTSNDVRRENVWEPRDSMEIPTVQSAIWGLNSGRGRGGAEMLHFRNLARKRVKKPVLGHFGRFRGILGGFWGVRGPGGPKSCLRGGAPRGVRARGEFYKSAVKDPVIGRTKRWPQYTFIRKGPTPPPFYYVRVSGPAVPGLPDLPGAQNPSFRGKMAEMWPKSGVREKGAFFRGYPPRGPKGGKMVCFGGVKSGTFGDILCIYSMGGARISRNMTM